MILLKSEFFVFPNTREKLLAVARAIEKITVREWVAVKKIRCESDENPSTQERVSGGGGGGGGIFVGHILA